MTQFLTDVERILQQMTGKTPRLLIVLAGPSGVGKNTIITKLLTNYQDVMTRVITYTTRPQRAEEIEGQQYHFVTPEGFQELAQAGRLMEVDADAAGHDVYSSGHWYSMPTDIFGDLPVETPLVIAEVDIHGMRRLRTRYPECVTVFVTAPPEILLRRIYKRGDTMDHKELGHRMDTAREQIKAAREFDYILFNEPDNLDKTIENVERIIDVERMRVRGGADLEAIVPEEAFNLPLEIPSQHQACPLPRQWKPLH